MAGRRLVLGAAAGASVLVGGAAVLAAGGVSTQLSVSPHTVMRSPSLSPIDAPATRAVRRGRAIPAGYAMIVRPVTITAGTEKAGAAFRMSCPAEMTTRTVAGSAQLVGPYHSRFVQVAVYAPSGLKAGTSTIQTAYLVCRR